MPQERGSEEQFNQKTEIVLARLPFCHNVIEIQCRICRETQVEQAALDE